MGEYRNNWVALAAVAAMVGLAGCAAFRPNDLGDLASLPAGTLPQDLPRSLTEDERRLGALAEQEQKLLATWASHLDELCAILQQNNRDLYLPSEEDELWADFGRLLALRKDLLAVASRYASYRQAGELRDRAMLLHTAAGMLACELDIRLTAVPCRGERRYTLIRRKLNEGRTDKAIPVGAFDMLCRSAASDWVRLERTRLLTGLPANADGQEENARSLRLTISAADEACRAGRGDADAAWSRALRESAAEAAYAPFSAFVQGFCRVIAEMHLPPHHCIHRDQIADVASRLRPGDILFTRKYGRATNGFIPGYWTHSMIYVGRAGDVAARGIKTKLPPETPSVVEAHSHGVTINALEESIAVDSLLVLRPNAAAEKVEAGLSRALADVGKPYDFDFDFFTGDKLTCSEVIYRAFGETLGLRPARRSGRWLLSAQDMADQLKAQFGKSGARVEFVLLLLGDARTNTSRSAEVGEIP